MGYQSEWQNGPQSEEHTLDLLVDHLTVIRRQARAIRELTVMLEAPDLAGDIADRTLVCEVEFPRQHGNRARPLRVCLSIAKLNQGGISDCEACPQKKTLDAALKTHGARLTGGEQDGIEVDLTWETV